MTTLDPEELASIMDAVSAGPFAARNRAPVSVWDLTSPTKNVPDPMPVLESANENVARRFAAALCGRTRIPLRLRANTPARVREEEVSSIIAPPNIVAVIELSPHHPDALLVVENTFAEALVLFGLGGNANSSSQNEPQGDGFTTLELVVLRRLLVLIEDALKESYRDLVDIEPRLTRIETDTRMALPFCPSDIALRMPFTVETPISSAMHLLVPFSVFEGHRKKLVSIPRHRTPSEQFAANLRRQMAHVPVSLEVELGRAPLSVEEMNRMRVGDIVTLFTEENAPLRVLIEGKHKMWGLPTVASGNLAVSIRDLVGPMIAEGHEDLAALALMSLSGAKEKSKMNKGGNELSPPEPTGDGSVDLHDVPLSVSVLLGRARIPLDEVLALRTGSVVELDKLAGEPLDVVLNGRLVARGEAVVVGDRFGVRVTEIIAARERSTGLS